MPRETHALLRPVSLLVPLLGFGLSAPAHAQSADDAMLVVNVASAGEADAGGTRVGAMHQGTLSARRPLRFRTSVRTGRCVMVVAHVGSGVRDVDVVVRRGRTRVAADTESGPRAHATYCAGEGAERLQVEVRTDAGSAAYAAAAYDIARPQARVETQAAARPLDTLHQLGEEHGEGYRPITPPAFEPALAEGTTLERTVPIAAGRCYRVLAAAEPTVTDLHVTLLDAAGGAVQTDGLEGPVVTLGVLRPLCPATSGSYVLRLEAAAGHGRVAWRVLAQERRAAATASARETHPVGGTGRGYVAQQIRRGHLAGGGGVGVVPATGGELARSATAERTFPVRAGRCYVAVAAGVPSARTISVSVRDAFGQERASGRGAPARARVCPAVAGTWRVQTKMELGYGRYAVQVFEQAP